MKSVDKGAFLTALKVNGHDLSLVEGDLAAAASGTSGAGGASGPARPVGAAPARRQGDRPQGRRQIVSKT